LRYLARIAFGQFGEGEYREFYNDLTAALRWLEAQLTWPSIGQVA
jgi:hypothetical protein